jgi:hypothetical protein
MSGDSPARFLGELRVLRDRAGIAHAELAIRAHYPVDVLVAAEAGPSLPDLPVLSAYVRACGGVPAEWEDRWRALTGAGGDSGLPSRPVGGSAAAQAGARAGATATTSEDHNPDQIMAVLSRVVSASGSASHTSAVPATGPGPGPVGVSDLGLGVEPGPAPPNGHWGSRTPASNPPSADASASSAWRSPIPVPSTPPPVPSAVPSPAPFATPERHGAASPAVAKAAALLSSARATRGGRQLSPAAIVLIVAVVLICVGILIAAVS